MSTKKRPRAKGARKGHQGRRVGLAVLDGTAERPLAPLATNAEPGSREKVEVLAARVAARQRTDHPGDRWYSGPGIPAPAAVPVVTTFAERLRALRLAAGLEQKALARRAGVDRTFVCKLELGRIGVGAAVACALADALGCSLDVLLGRVPLE
jgi:DNA-binding XRE family transcriptional regulator